MDVETAARYASNTSNKNKNRIETGRVLFLSQTKNK
jgi:hypothetical protein